MGKVIELTDGSGCPASTGALQTGQELRAAAGAVLQGALLAMGEDRLTLHGHTLDSITVGQLADLWRPSHASVGIGTAFEFAVERAFRLGAGEEYERLVDALDALGFGPVADADAFVFGPEKSGRADVIRHAHDKLTDSSTVWSPSRGNRLRLRSALGSLVIAHGTRGEAGRLPERYADLWRADVFLGCRERDVWTGVSCKVDRSEVCPAGQGVSFAVAPGTRHGRGDRRPFQMLRDMPTVSFPRGASVWWNLERSRRALERWLSVDGSVDRVAADMMPDLVQLLRELHDRRRESALDISWDWLVAADAGVTKLWTPRAGVSLAA